MDITKRLLPLCLLTLVVHGSLPGCAATDPVTPEESAEVDSDEDNQTDDQNDDQEQTKEPEARGSCTADEIVFFDITKDDYSYEFRLKSPSEFGPAWELYIREAYTRPGEDYEVEQFDRLGTGFECTFGAGAEPTEIHCVKGDHPDAWGDRFEFYIERQQDGHYTVREVDEYGDLWYGDVFELVDC